MINIIISIVFLVPAFKLNLFNQNYSTLSLSTEGYLYVLILGTAIGALLGYETFFINNKLYAVSMFLSMFTGVMVPHHVPYDLQGSLHLLCAYLGFSGIVIITMINLYKNILLIKKLRYIFSLSILASICIYLVCGMVNTASEIIVMFAVLSTNLYLYLRMR